MEPANLDPVMPPPMPGKVPMKANVFEAARQSNTQLLPLFPYLGPSDIVPCCASYESDGTGTRFGYFLHTNSVDEVVISFGSTGPARTGDVMVGPRAHGVGGVSDQPYFAVLTITQRNLDEGPQPESITFPCEKCSASLYQKDFSGETDAARQFPPMATISGCMIAALDFNAAEDKRKCDACGHANPPFPLPMWGWQHHMRNSDVIEKAWRALEGSGT